MTVTTSMPWVATEREQVRACVAISTPERRTGAQDTQLVEGIGGSQLTSSACRTRQPWMRPMSPAAQVSAQTRSPPN